MASAKAFAEKLLTKAGIELDGNRPQDISVHNDELFTRVIRYGSLGLGEGYMDGWWDANELDAFFTQILNAHLDREVKLNVKDAFTIAQAFALNMQSNKRAFKVGEVHYDLGNDLYEKMLDTRMVYTCGYWSSPSAPAKDLDDAQEQKLDLICRKIGLKEGDRVLDIGCGWGSFAKFAAQKYGAHVVGITISKEQAALAKENCKGLPVEIRVQDYRHVREQFDHIVSIGMFEHVGPKNYRTYFKVARRCLKDGGFFLLHTIGQSVSARTSDAWINKYIFPGGVIPSITQIGKASEGLFQMEDWHNFGPDYDKTLMAWFANFEKAWPQLREKYGDRFYRMWKYYLLSCAGAFRSRTTHLWQIVLSKDGVSGGYESIR